MRQYVRVVNGTITEGPKPLSEKDSISPNQYWGFDQMKENGFFEVDLKIDSVIESIDYQNPSIKTNSVTYPRISKTNTQILTYCKKVKIKELREKAGSIFLEKHDIAKNFAVIYGFLTNGPATALKNDFQTLFNSLVTGESNVNALTTRAEIEAYIHTFPSI